MRARTEVLAAPVPSPLLRGLTTRQREVVASLGTTIDVGPGRVLIAEAARGNQTFLIVAGVARCLVAGQVVGCLRTGAIFGETALIDGEPRCVTVVAATPLTVTVFHRREFASLLGVAPRIAENLQAAMATRLRTDARAGAGPGGRSVGGSLQGDAAPPDRHASEAIRPYRVPSPGHSGSS